MPTLQEWKQKYGAQGLKVVAVHAPRQEDDMDAAKIRATAEEFNVSEPCAVDNEHNLADQFQIGGLWPHYFLFDSEGKLRSRSAGNAGLSNIESTLNRILTAAEPVTV
jgi:thiol-disulfide isomerase/thioredoxin